MMTKPSNTDNIRAFSNVPSALVSAFGDEGDLTRQHLLNPAIFSLLTAGAVNPAALSANVQRLLPSLREEQSRGEEPDLLVQIRARIEGKAILDAGCGQGYLSRILARMGARVTGIEPAESWYRYALQREQTERLGINYLQKDLSLFELAPASFDYVIANMVFMDIPDYLPALHNCVASLKNNGGLIISLLHPCFEELASFWQEGATETNYFHEYALKQRYGHLIHRPLSTYLNDIIQAGCVLQKVLEPALDATVAKQHQAEKYAHTPGYIVLYATRSEPRSWRE
ncbi:class I SAM-dependent methyltransferase [Ktedonosporobacter rubrisoli]|uniref:Class I SAM-dependent methyltransferase n=1 Tax=Ktedonosporobacter rubrisoli TaxID=2509675 RepID=A0A4P6JLZ5_KTERU|nr:class I SAM-dependent methyltransferase [Ktedonosporobacter rubrisoli]QBD76113.1 class I SAM-dependent methyltransferase [Ktedonosporobacter rubrisoli]